MVVSIYKFSSQKQKEEERERNGAGKKVSLESSVVC